jgi:hypothetical protein
VGHFSTFLKASTLLHHGGVRAHRAEIGAHVSNDSHIGWAHAEHAIGTDAAETGTTSDAIGELGHALDTLERVIGSLESQGASEVTGASVSGAVVVVDRSESINANDVVSVDREGGDFVAVVSGSTSDDGGSLGHIGSSRSAWVTDSKVGVIVGLEALGARLTEVRSLKGHNVSLERSTNSVVLGGEGGGAHLHFGTLDGLTDAHVTADVARGTYFHGTRAEWLTESHFLSTDAAGFQV